MKKRYLMAALLLLALAACAAPAAAAGTAPDIEWQRLLGGSGWEQGASVRQAADGGYVLLARSDSSRSGDVAGTNHGGGDLWAVNLDGSGAIRWQRLLGGDLGEQAGAVRQTADGGYVLVGNSDSSASGNVTGSNHAYGSADLWVVKLDAAGAIEWQQLLGGGQSDYGYEIEPTADGGYIAIGYTWSSESGDVSGKNHGSDDIWVMKLNATGTIQWQGLLGGNGMEVGVSVRPLADGGYLLAGSSTSGENGDVAVANHGHNDIWLVKLNGNGTLAWQRLYGGTGYDYGPSVALLPDGGYLLAGTSTSSASGDVTGTNHGDADIWIARLNATGGIQWDRLLGGAGAESIADARSVPGGFIVAGTSSSSASGNVTGASHGGNDAWTVRLNAAGGVEWEELLGGSGEESAAELVPEADGGYLLLANSGSSRSGNVTAQGHGGDDLWVVRLAGGPAVLAVLPGTALPTDTNADGLYDDVNGNGRKDFGDVVLYFNGMTWIAANEPVSLFDCNGNGRIDFADVVWLFTHL